MTLNSTRRKCLSSTVASQATRWALDTSVVVGAFSNSKDHCSQLLNEIDEEGLEIVASTLLIAECVYVKSADTAAMDQMLRFLAGPRILWVELTHGVAMQAARLAKEHRMAGADAVHLASAVEGKASAIFTDDLGKKKGRGCWPIGNVVSGVTVFKSDDRPLNWASRLDLNFEPSR